LESLVMLDRDESALHAVQLSLGGRALLDDRRLVLADIRDRQRMADVFLEHRPQVVFHAAALKHLPMLEMYPQEAVKSNVWGTLNLLEVAAAARTERFVNISTDKAADPTSTLGYSKRIAERLTSWYNARSSGVFVSVRFGNVLGSRGSVLTAFESQVAEGADVTVTDPAVTRFFMTVQEAIRLVIQAAALGNGGEALVLDMGEPVRIADVAQRLIDDAGSPSQIVFTGLRPGEKLHECLFAESESPELIHDLTFRVNVPPLNPSDVSGLPVAGTVDEVIQELRAVAVGPMRLPAPREPADDYPVSLLDSLGATLRRASDQMPTA
jgi:FlaA1/EpsC-like NDP-sugar epimerase